MNKNLETKRDELADKIEEIRKKTWVQNNKDYWDAHVQFGSDIEMRNAWFHDVGFDCGAQEMYDILFPLIEESKKVLDEECYCNEHEGVMVICDPCLVLAKIESILGPTKSRRSDEDRT